MAKSTLTRSRQHFIQGMSRISNFWGFPKAMGAIYGAIYLSPNPVSLDELVEQAGVSKGAVSTNVRQLERFNMVHRHLVVGDRKDYYTAETDFWKMIKSILQQREQHEFDKALGTVAESLELAEQAGEDPELSAFYQERMGAMESFFKTLDSLFSAAMALDGLVSLSTIRTMLEKAGKK
jgi:DNA-binding transcriptional regulator GbsR (MarR family)